MEPNVIASKRSLRLALTVLAIAAAMIFGARKLHPSAAANIGSVAYCVTSEGAPAVAGLNAALYTVDEGQLALYDSGNTDHNGCGVFNYVPVGQPAYIVTWSDDGLQAGNSSWFRSDAMVVAPVIELHPSTGETSAWMGVFAAQALAHRQ